jgi:hypothetical protein
MERGHDENAASDTLNSSRQGPRPEKQFLHEGSEKWCDANPSPE